MITCERRRAAGNQTPQTTQTPQKWGCPLCSHTSVDYQVIVTHLERGEKRTDLDPLEVGGA